MKKNIYIFILILFSFYSCDNPFAPRLSNNSGTKSILGDQTTINGLFENFRYAYIFKDTIVYGNLLDDEFKFIFRNYEKGIDEFWGRTEEMITTSRLFLATKSIDLTWNDITNSIGDSLDTDISRAFNLKIVFTDTDIINIYGRVNMRLSRKSTNLVWKIKQWRDESNF